MLRTEKKVLTKDGLPRNEWDTINGEFTDWEIEIKDRCKKLQEVVKGDQELDNFPPIRQSIKNSSKNDTLNVKKGTSRIKACDYQSWDKYDPDAEILKMEFDEERNREQIQMKMLKSEEEVPKLIEEISEVTPNMLSETEKEIFADQHRVKGNEHFKAKEYGEALVEYTKSLKFMESAAGFNNRAITCKFKMNTISCFSGIFSCFFYRFKVELTQGSTL